MFVIKSNKIIIGENLFDGFIYVDKGKIVRLSHDCDADNVIDYSGRFVSAGFIDIHTHGGGGYGFMESSPDDVVAGCNFHLKHGTTSILPTVSAAEFETMEQAVKNIDSAKKNKQLKNNILGAHLEGPYLSPKQCGAQGASFLTDPIKKDYEKLIRNYGDSVLRWTYAPERDTEGVFCKFLTANGIVASAGHTDATYSDMVTAIEKGCNLITHLYSCTSTVTRDHGFRRLGVIESAFLRDDLFVEIIADGKHLPPDLIKMIVKIKGADKIALITDSLSVAGTDVKEGVMSGTEYIIEDGICKLKDRSAFAGSIATADLCVRVVKDTGVDIPVAVKMMTEIPAEIINAKNKGKIAVGKDADLVVFDDDIKIFDVYVGGEIKYSEN